MKKTFKQRWVLLLLVLFSTSVWSGVVVNTSPSPAKAGDVVRLSVISDDPLSRVVLIHPNGKQDLLLYVNENLHRLTFNVPEKYPLDSYSVTLKLFSITNEVMELPYRLGLLTVNFNSSFSIESNGEAQQQQSKTAELELEIESLELRLDDLQLERQQLKNKLEQSKKDINDIKNDATKREELAKKQKELEKLQSELEKKNKLVDDAMKQLKLQAVALNEKQANLEVKESVLEEKEATLLVLEKDIETKTGQLDALKSSLSLRESVLSSVEQNLNSEKESVNSQKVKLTSLTKSVESERFKLISLTEEMDKLQREYEEEQDQLRAQNLKETSALVQRRTELGQLQKSFEQSQTILKKRESEQQQLTQELTTELAELEAQKQEYTEHKQKLDKEKKQMELLENDLAVRYEMLNSLKEWLSVQLTELQTTYEKKSKKNDDYLVTFDQRFGQLDNLTKLIEDRAFELDRMNAALEDKNKLLNLKLQGDYGYSSLFAVSPYLGIKNYLDGSYSLSKIIGFRFSTSLSSRFNLQGIAAYQSANKIIDNSTKTRSKIYPELHLNYTFTPFEKYDFYASTGMRSDFRSDENILISLIGCGLRFPLEEGKYAYVESHLSNGIDVSFGIEKTFLYKTPRSVEVKEIVAPITKAKKRTDIVVTSPKLLRHMIPAESDVDMYYRHWAYQDMYRVSSLGLMEIDKTTFNPSGFVTKMEATKMLVLSYYVRDFLKEQSIPITVSILGEEGERFSLKLSVINSDGNEVRVISKKLVYSEELTFFWDGRDQSGRYVPSGSYTIVADIQEPELTLVAGKDAEIHYKSVRKATTLVDVYSLLKPEFKARIHALNFKDVPRSSTNYSYVSESVYLNLVKVKENVLNAHEDVYYHPEETLTRGEFISLVSRVLYLFGVDQRYIKIDLSAYADKKDISEEIKPLLQTYIFELGYGGDEKQRLRLSDKITQAEAAVILSRLLEWIETKNP